MGITRLLVSWLVVAASLFVAGCASEGPTQPVAAAGAPTLCSDADSDGVCDVDDRCPMTPANVRVDATGCAERVVAPAKTQPAPTRMAFSARALFGDDQSVLLPAGRLEVNRLAEYLKAHPASTVRIEGHTDNRGPLAYNQRLSLARANAVRDDLIGRHGIAPSRIRTVGHADRQPVGDNGTSEGRALNRRVEARIQDHHEAAP